MMPVNMSAASLQGEHDGDLVFHETFPAVMSEKRPKAHGVERPPGERAIAVFFHPDCNRRLRPRTGSADLPAETGSARGLVSLRKPTAGGEFRPALKTLWRLVSQGKPAGEE